MQKEFEQKEFNQTINLHCGCGGTGSGAVPSIGENGNWFIGDEDTGISAQGPKGDTGATGEPGPKGDAVSSLDLKLLFSGQANTQGAEYELVDSIENYKLFIIEYNTQDSGGGYQLIMALSYLRKWIIKDNMEMYCTLKMEQQQLWRFIYLSNLQQ